MRWYIAILAAGLASVSFAADDDAKADLAKLEGSWEVVSIEMGGKKADPGKGAPEKAVIKDGKATFFSNGKEMPTFKELRLELDPKKKPKAIDLVRSEKERLPCIYELKGDDLKFVMPLVSTEPKNLTRPEAFDTKDKQVLLMILKRTKKRT